MRIASLFVTLLFLCTGLRNKPPVATDFIKATTIIAAKASDGIVIAIDSRAAIYDTEIFSKPPVIYVDSLCKTFKLKNYIITTSGSFDIGTQTYAGTITDFNKLDKKYTDIESTFRAYRDFLEKKYPDSLFHKKNMFIGGGYDGSRQVLIGFDHANFMTNNVIVSNPNLFQYLNKFGGNRSYTCEELAPKLEKVILDFARDFNQTSTTGGPISIVKIYPGNKIQFLQNNFSKNRFETFKSFVDAIESNKLKSVELVKDGKKKALSLLKSGPKYKN